MNRDKMTHQELRKERQKSRVVAKAKDPRVQFKCRSCGERVFGVPKMMNVVIGYVPVCGPCWEENADES